MGAKTDDVFTLSVKISPTHEIASFHFKGKAFKFSQPPGDYYLKVVQIIKGEIKHPKGKTLQFRARSLGNKIEDLLGGSEHPTNVLLPLEPLDPLPADLYEHCTVNFGKLRVFRGTRDKPKEARPAKLELIGAPDTELIIQNVQTGESERCEYKFSGEVSPGKYLLKMIENGVTIKAKEITVQPGDSITLDLGQRQKSRLKDALLRVIPHDDRRVFFSESLGRMANADLGLWLSIIGASRIVGDPSVFQKLKALPLLSFQDAKPGDSPIYVLVGLESMSQTVQCGVSQDDNPKWNDLQPVKNLGGIYERCFQGSPGSHLVSLKITGKTPVTVAVYGLENRATLITMTEAENGELQIHQYLLPIYNLLDKLDPEVYKLLHPNPLQMVRFIALAQHQFALKVPVKISEVNRDWDSLLAGEWFDPIMSIMASYELLRRGRRDQFDKLLISLKQLSPGLPDIQAIEKLAGHRSQMPKAVPIFLDGLLAFDNYHNLLPLSEHHLDFHGPWTSWRGAVKI
jgi:hypothetical protein